MYWKVIYWYFLILNCIFLMVLNYPKHPFRFSNHLFFYIKWMIYAAAHIDKKWRVEIQSAAVYSLRLLSCILMLILKTTGSCHVMLNHLNYIDFEVEIQLFLPLKYYYFSIPANYSSIGNILTCLLYFYHILTMNNFVYVIYFSSILFKRKLSLFLFF